MTTSNTKVVEAFDNKIRELGEVNFSKTSFDDAHVKQIISEVAKKLKVSEAQVISDIEAELKKFDSVAKKSPILYQTIEQNIIEKYVFDLVEKHKVSSKAPRFSLIMFNDLMKYIKIEHDQFFPLRNFIDSKHLYKPVIILVPNPRYPEYENVDTAAATPNGHFIFNVPFMQQLMDYANIKGVQPKGKKYSNNGGPIPAEYAYIEFLIIHEFMHYTYADFYYQDQLKADGEIINWVGDFRTNYLLVKSGFEQLPIGLFNDHINYDRQKTYKEMYEIVKAEFEKLNKNEKQQVSDILNDLGDDHSKSKPGDGGNSPGEPKDGEDSSGEPKNKGKPSGEPKGGDPFEQADEDNGKISKQISKKKEASEEDLKGDNDSKKDGKQKAGKSNGEPGKGAGAGGTFDYSKVRPTFNWKKLLEKMIAEAGNNVEETYQKPHRRNVSSVDMVRQTGAGAMKPGEMPLPNQIKLGFVIDSSGSMSSAVAVVYANIERLFKSNQIDKGKEFTLIKFSSDFDAYRCNYRKNMYYRVASVKDKKGDGTESGDIKNLFTTTINGGTHFGGKLVPEIEHMLKNSYNVLVMSDYDITAGENYDVLERLLKTYKKNLFVVLDEHETFVALARKMKQVPRNVTYFS
jgi:predicted metal-dependent peptidase